MSWREVHERSHSRGDVIARRWNIVAVAVAFVTGLGAALLPLGEAGSIDTNGLETNTRVSLLSNEGAGVLIIVAIPMLLVVVPLLLHGETARRSRAVIVALLAVLVVLGALSIGLFFVPTLLAMVTSLATQYSIPSRPSSTATPPA